MALCYYTIAALFSLAQYKISRTNHYLFLLGIACGMAMSVKYTSFVVPLACGLLLLFERPVLSSIRTAAQFSGIAILTALPWYLRNTIMMGNPFYPFVFGGRYWDSFLAKWYGGTKAGISWEPIQILRLPLDTILGHHDTNYFDGRIGPLFLVLAPLTIWFIFTRPRQNGPQNWSLLSIGFYSPLAFATWTFGVINSASLWQTRLLIPTLLPFAILTALGWDALPQLNTSKFRLGFPINAFISIVIALSIIDGATYVLQRNPLAVAFGAISRERYIERINKPYSDLMQTLDELPTDAKVYNLFEPRSYQLAHIAQPDFILSNFAHDVFIYQTPDTIIRQWDGQGYTHILVYEHGLQFILENNPEYMKPSLQNALNETLGKLHLLSQTPDGVYSIYKIP